MLKLRPYQEEAASFLYEHDRAMILAPVGAGKTAITLAALDRRWKAGKLRRVLILAPKRVCTDVWPVEIPKWSQFLSPILAMGTERQRNLAFKPPAETGANAVIMNYENIQWLANKMGDHSIAEMGFDGVVFDELTRLKNPSGKRFKAFEKLVKGVEYRWGLTGSFTSNGLEDVFGQCKIVDTSLLGRTKGAFLQQYFVCINREFGDWQPRKGALEQIMAKIKPATFVLDPGEYKDKLPELRVVETACAMDDLKPYETMKRDFVLNQIVAPTAAAVTSKLQQMASGFIYDENRRATWLSYHKMAALDEILEGNQRANTIVVYNYVEELAELQRRYPRAQTINDDRAVERWNKGEIEMLLIHPKSAGHGLNLQHGGHHIVFMSLPWSLELYEQTVGRLHRGGQSKDVWCYVLLCHKTIDERIWRALHDKRDISDIALEELSC
jgi:SNF2 family DNA or RNA helicase